MADQQQPNDLAFYDEYTRRHNKAHEAFVSTHSTRYPPPVKPRLSWTNYLNFASILGVTTASVIVSASRTIAEFGGDFIGLMGFVMADVGMIVITFNRTRLNPNSRIEHTRRLGWFATGAMVLILLAANINHEMSISEDFDRALKFILAVSAPLMSIVFGDMLAVESIWLGRWLAAQIADWEVKYAEWMAGLDAAWDKNQSRMNATFKVQKAIPVSPALSNGNSNGNSAGNGLSIGTSNGHEPALLESARTSLGHTKVRDASERAKQYLLENPTVLKMGKGRVQHIMTATGVGKQTVYNVLAAIESDMESAQPVLSVDAGIPAEE